MELDEEFNAEQRPKLELSMGPDGEVIFTEIPMERIAQEKFDKEFNFDWSEYRTTDDCEQNQPVISTDIDPDLFLVHVKKTKVSVDNTKLHDHETTPSTEYYTQECDIAKSEINKRKYNAVNGEITPIAQKKSTASENYEQSEITGIPKSYCKKQKKKSKRTIKKKSKIVTKCNSVRHTKHPQTYSENSLITTLEGYSEQSIASNLNYSQGSEENMHSEICMEDSTNDISMEHVADNSKSYLQESPDSANNDDLLKEFIEADAKVYSRYQQESPKNMFNEFIEAFTKKANYSNQQGSPKNANNDEFLKEFIEANTEASSHQKESPKNAHDENLFNEFIELSNVEPFIATGKNYTPSGNNLHKPTEAETSGKTYSRDNSFCETTEIVSKTYSNNEKTMEFSPKMYSMEYTTNSETYTKKVSIAPLSQKSIEASTDAFGTESFPDISDYQIESALKADDEALEEFIEASAKALLEPSMEEYMDVTEDSMDANSKEPSTTPGMVFTEAPLTDSIKTCQETVIAKSENKSKKSVEVSKITLEELVANTVKMFLKIPSSSSIESGSRDTFIAKSGNKIKKSVEASKNSINKELFANTGKLFLEEPPLPSIESRNKDDFKAKSGNRIKQSAESNRKSLSQELIANTGKMFLEVPPSPNIERVNLDISIAKIENKSKKSFGAINNTFEELLAKTDKMFLEVPPSPSIESGIKDTFIANSGNKCKKSVESSKITFEELVANTVKTFLDIPSSPSVESDSQNTFIAKSGNRIKNSVKSNRKTFSEELFTTTGKIILEEPPSPTIESGSQDTVIEKRGNKCIKSVESSKKTFSEELFATTGKMLIEIPELPSIECRSQDTLIEKRGNRSKSVESSKKMFSKELIAKTGKMFLEVPPSPSIESIKGSGNSSVKYVVSTETDTTEPTFTIICEDGREETIFQNVESNNQDTFLANSGNNNMKSVKSSMKTYNEGPFEASQSGNNGQQYFGKQLFATTGKVILSTSIQSGSQNTFIAQSKKSVEARTKTFGKELCLSTDKMFFEIPQLASIESMEKSKNNSVRSVKASTKTYINEPLTGSTYEMVCEEPVKPRVEIIDNIIVKNANDCQKYIDGNTKNCSKDPFISTGKKFLEVPPSPSFDTFSQSPFTATGYSQKALDISTKNCSKELFTITGQMLVKVPPSSPSIRNYIQDNFIAKIENNHQKTNKTMVDTHRNYPFIASYKTFLEELQPKSSSNAKAKKQDTFKIEKIGNLSEYTPLKISEPYFKDSPMISNDYDCQLSPVARTEDCSLGSPISINESFCLDSPRSIIEESKLEWSNQPNLSKESQLDWPNLSMDDVSVNCGDKANGVILMTYDDSLDDDIKEPLAVKELTSKEKKLSMIDHRTLSGKYKKKYRYRPRPDFKKPLPKPCNKYCKTCHICNKEFGRQRLLLVHMRRHTDSLNLHCEFCEKKFAASYDLERHVRNIHIARKAYSCYCSLCRIPFYSRTAAVDHQKRAHSHIAQRFVDNYDDDVEMTPVAPPLPLVEDKFDIVCDVCGMKFCEKCDLDAHHNKFHSNVSDLHLNLDTFMKPHVAQKRFGIHCNMCSFKFKEKADLDNHIMKAHSVGVEIFSCDICGLKYKEKHDLDSHIMKSHSVEIFSCDTCGLQFNEKSDLDDHVKSHDKQLIIQFYTPHKIEANTNVTLII